MDNRIISIQSEGRQAFDLSFQLLFDNAPGGKARYFIDHPTAGFVLLWNEDKFQIEDKLISASKLPYPMGWKAAAEFSWGWLEHQPKENYQECLDHDGSNHRGFKVYNEDWGHVASSHYGILGILPIWAWYGK